MTRPSSVSRVPRSTISPIPDPFKRTLAEAPIPPTVSAAAQSLWKKGLPLPEAPATSLAEQRAICDRIQREFGGHLLEKYPVEIDTATIAGVDVRIFTPAEIPQRNRERILVNCHGGGFVKDSGSLTENIPIAYLTRTKVVAICYRLAPEHPFPAAVDDVEAVYTAILDEYAPERLGLYGTSAGAILSAQTIVRLMKNGDPLPALLGFFAGTADFSRIGDSEYFFPLLDDPRPVNEVVAPYLGNAPRRDPELSPIFADLSHFPPTLCLCGTRDLMFSQTTLFHRALLQAGVSAELAVFEAMPHAHWSYLDLPESDEAFAVMARYLDRHI